MCNKMIHSSNFKIEILCLQEVDKIIRIKINKISFNHHNKKTRKVISSKDSRF